LEDEPDRNAATLATPYLMEVTFAYFVERRGAEFAFDVLMHHEDPRFASAREDDAEKAVN
jgi:hypothetical protein